jgi:hypothetical protein
MRRHRWLLAAAALALGGVAAALGAGIGLATIDGGEMIHACAKPSGDLRLVDEPGECKKKERAVSWSATGPAGEPGAPGAQGPPGATNIAPVYSRVASVETPADTVGNPLAECLPGDQIVAGGFYLSSAAGSPFTGKENVRLLASYPQMPENGWQIFAYNSEAYSVRVVATVVCLDLTS